MARSEDDTTPPQVVGVYVSGTAWSQAFLNYLASEGLGSSTLGYLIPAGANQLSDLPWVNIKTISVVFNENVSINTADSALQLLGSPNLPAPAPLSGATYYLFLRDGHGDMDVFVVAGDRSISAEHSFGRRYRFAGIDAGRRVDHVDIGVPFRQRHGRAISTSNSTSSRRMRNQDGQVHGTR